QHPKVCSRYVRTAFIASSIEAHRRPLLNPCVFVNTRRVSSGMPCEYKAWKKEFTVCSQSSTIVLSLIKVAKLLGRIIRQALTVACNLLRKISVGVFLQNGKMAHRLSPFIVGRNRKSPHMAGSTG